MTDEQTKRMNELANEAYGDPIGSMRHEAFSKVYTAGHQDASAEKDKEIEALSGTVEFFLLDLEEVRKLNTALQSELTALKESAKGLVEALEYYASTRFNREIMQWMPGNPDKAINALAAYNAKIGG